MKPGQIEGSRMVTEEMAALASPHVQRQLQWEGCNQTSSLRREFESASDTSLPAPASIPSV